MNQNDWSVHYGDQAGDGRGLAVLLMGVLIGAVTASAAWGLAWWLA